MTRVRGAALVAAAMRFGMFPTFNIDSMLLSG